MISPDTKVHIGMIAATAIMLSSIGGLVIYQQKNVSYLLSTIEQMRAETASTTTQIDATIGILAERLSAAQQNTADLSTTLYQQLSSLQSQVGGISGSISTLEKLTQTDPELLQKYSKVFFLNENYRPSTLATIEKVFTYDENKQYQIHAQVLPYLIQMMSAARNAGVTFEVKSAYRSFDEQNSIKNSYKVTYGAGTANTFSADQGYSEHQLGTAVDFTANLKTGAFDGFGKSPEYAWLIQNANLYGFILSYPENNSYYVFEPWHWRFVGKRLARDLFLQRKNFYDLDQREIDKYLVTIFD